jgi:hypothetical protein
MPVICNWTIRLVTLCSVEQQLAQRSRYSRGNTQRDERGQNASSSADLPANVAQRASGFGGLVRKKSGLSFSSGGRASAFRASPIQSAADRLDTRRCLAETTNPNGY